MSKAPTDVADDWSSSLTLWPPSLSTPTSNSSLIPTYLHWKDIPPLRRRCSNEVRLLPLPHFALTHTCRSLCPPLLHYPRYLPQSLNNSRSWPILPNIITSTQAGQRRPMTTTLTTAILANNLSKSPVPLRFLPLTIQCLPFRPCALSLTTVFGVWRMNSCISWTRISWCRIAYGWSNGPNRSERCSGFQKGTWTRFVSMKHTPLFLPPSSFLW